MGFRYVEFRLLGVRNGIRVGVSIVVRNGIRVGISMGIRNGGKG